MNPPASSRKTAPGPPGHPIVGVLNEFREDRLRFLLGVRQEYGDVVRLQIGPRLVHLVSHPDWVHYVLATHHDNYHKSEQYRREATERLVGKGLVTSEGELWQRDRKLAQPAFHLDRIKAFGTLMTESTQAMLDRWESYATSGESFDIAPEMSRLTLTIVARALFTTDISDEASAVGKALTTALHHVRATGQSLLPLPEALPTPANRQFQRAMATLDKVVYGMIAERRKSGQDTGDLLSMLLAARDAESGETMSDQQLRDEVMTLLLAGHETTSNTLNWIWYLLGKNPPAERRLHAELDEVLGGRVATVDDLPKLRYTMMVVQESMRLYPAVWGIGRTPLQDDEIAGYHIPAGSSIILSQYVVHRHPDFWDQPEGFDPERFTGHPPAAYFPFGGGPRVCIGNNFALIEARLILATIAQRYRLQLVPGHPVEPDPVVTLRPREGVRVTIRPYQPAAPGATAAPAPTTAAPGPAAAAPGPAAATPAPAAAPPATTG